MKICRCHIPLAALLLSTAAMAAQPASLNLSPGEILARSPAEDWQPVPPQDMLLLEFEGGRNVAIQLAPHYAPTHVANIRRLVADGWFARHSAITRVQENYVVQWGDASEAAVLPAGIVARPDDGYAQPGAAPHWRALPFRDAYAPQVGHADGWPVAADAKAHWLPHCPTMVGVGRNMPPDTGTGAELYVVIGHGPRHLDRNIALVGRVLDGMEGLSALPRGTGPLGTYEKPEQQVKLHKARMAADLPDGQAPRFQVLRTDSASFRQWVGARANRRDGFFIRPAGGADICNLLPPVRRAPQAK